MSTPKRRNPLRTKNIRWKKTDSVEVTYQAHFRGRLLSLCILDVDEGGPGYALYENGQQTDIIHDWPIVWSRPGSIAEWHQKSLKERFTLVLAAIKEQLDA